MKRLDQLNAARTSDSAWLDRLSRDIFDDLRKRTLGRRGVTRASWGEGETIAANLIRDHAHALGLLTKTDPIGNLYVGLAGRDPGAKKWATGSHLDSVPDGGNFDGAAGVVAGLLSLAIFKRTGLIPERDVWVVGFRGEEASSWFSGDHKSHFGSRAALGVLGETELDTAIHSQSGLSFRHHIDRLGFKLPAAGAGELELEPEKLHGFLELHIEQGPTLETRGISVGVVTGIRGSLRVRQGRVIGEYAHSGAVPHYLRKDAVYAAADFATECERLGEQIRSMDGDLEITLGTFVTDSKAHSITKVPGELRFTIDVRSISSEILSECGLRLTDIAARIARARGVEIQLHDLARSEPVTMHRELISLLDERANQMEIPSILLASGAGHDAAEFGRLGIPTGMIFVRNSRGSHNPDEEMAIEDFLDGVWILSAALSR